MISNYNINLHFNQAVAQRTGYAFKIGDKGCKFNIHCEDLDPTEMNPHIIFNHSDGTCVEGIPTTISARDYEYVIQGNEFGVCGKTVVDVKFYDGDPATQRISTASFMIEILPDTITPFDEGAGPYADSLERAKEELDEATSDLSDMDALFAQTLQDYIDAFGNTAPINPRGAYDPDTLYKPRDAVYYTSGGKTLTYLNNLECTGVDPTNTSNWQPIVDITGIPAIIDNCTSTSTTDALSANQGRVLSEELSHRNLVDNPFFTVNQRGFTSGTVSALNLKACVDRWYITYGTSGTQTVTLGSSGIAFDIVASDYITLYQTYEKMLLKTNEKFTFSVMLANGTIHSITKTWANVTDTWAVTSDIDFAIVTELSRYAIKIKADLTVKAVKLELGSVSTLANDVEPNYTTELLKCQRYFYRLEATGIFAVMANRSAYTAYLMVNLPAPMRATPTVSYAGAFEILEMSVFTPVTSITLGKVASQIMSGSVDCAGGLTAGYGSVLHGNAGAYIDFSADL